MYKYEKFSAYGQAMIRNGGRNGIALSGGFRWALGKAGDEKVSKPQNKVFGFNLFNFNSKKKLSEQTRERKVLKQLSKGTITHTNGIIKKI